MIPLTWSAGAAAVALAAGLAAGYIKGHHDGDAALRADWDKQQLTQQREYINRLRDANEQIEVMRNQDRDRQETYEAQIRRVGSQRDAALASLRNRPERAAVPGSCGPAEAAAGTAGSVVYRADAAVLIGIAARADELRAALERCQGGDIGTEQSRLDH